MLIIVEARRYDTDYFQAWHIGKKQVIQYIGRFYTFNLMMDGIKKWMNDYEVDELIVNYQDLHTWNKSQPDIYKMDDTDFTNIENELF